MLDQLKQLYEEAGLSVRAGDDSIAPTFEVAGVDVATAWSVFKCFALIPVEAALDDDLLLFQWTPTSLDFRRQIAVYEEGEFDGLDHIFCHCDFENALGADHGNFWSHKIGKPAFFDAVEASAAFKARLETQPTSVTVGCEH
jgi:hypothetical protein